MPEMIYFPVRGDTVYLADDKIGTVINDNVGLPSLYDRGVWYVNVMVQGKPRLDIKVSWRQSLGAWEEQTD